MQERRVVPRVEPLEPLFAKVRGRTVGKVLDISSRGAQLELADALAPRAQVEVRIHLRGEDVIFHARVQRCRALGYDTGADGRRVLRYVSGLEFEDVSPEAMARLSEGVLFQSATVFVSAAGGSEPGK